LKEKGRKKEEKRKKKILRRKCVLFEGFFEKRPLLEERRMATSATSVKIIRGKTIITIEIIHNNE
tara:strand:- start:495 stop:689 length:195 start_codon:yes stop_codon:yes gene_type:complete